MIKNFKFLMRLYILLYLYSQLVYRKYGQLIFGGFWKDICANTKDAIFKANPEVLRDNGIRQWSR